MVQTPEERRAYQREYQRAWRMRNPDKVKQIQAKSRALNRDRLKEQRRAWREKNREKERTQARARRALQPLRNQHGPWAEEDRATLLAAQGGRCYLCGEEMTQKSERIDHDHSCCPKNQSCRICRRGVAHHGCNILIGLAGDDPAALRRIADALEAAQLAFTQRKTAANKNTGEQLALPH